MTANNTIEIVPINRPKGLSLENKLTKFYHNPSLKKFKCRATARSYPTTKRDCSGVQKQGLSPDGWQRGYHNFQLNYVKDSSSLFLFCLQTLVEILTIYII